MNSRSLTVGGVVLLGLVWLAMMLLGTGPTDHALLGALYAGSRPMLRSAAQAVTIFGNWQTVILVSIFGAAWLLYRRQRRSALLLLAVTLVGRTLVEAQKWGVHRLRPEDQAHLVPAKSLSFPSAHAANSMMLFLTIALLVAPPRWRREAVALALIGAALVGLSRPVLGVHWPSDVVGGWAFGAAWVLAMLALAERWPARVEPVR
jgi:undecaprenyl-diphosphatase